jgi:ribonucleotide reductase alpha subunit
MHFYAWKQGLKTGCYYLRTKPPVMAQKFTVDPKLLQGSTSRSNSIDIQDSDSSSSDEEEKPVTETRAQKLERLSREYDESVKEAQEEGCTLCSS